MAFRPLHDRFLENADMKLHARPGLTETKVEVNHADIRKEDPYPGTVSSNEIVECEFLAFIPQNASVTEDRELQSGPAVQNRCS